MNKLTIFALLVMTFGSLHAMADESSPGSDSWGSRQEIRAINKGIEQRAERDAEEIAALKLKWQKTGLPGHEHGNAEKTR